MCAFLSRFFESRGFQTLIAQSGREAIEALHRQMPDYLLLDLRMPGVSGFEVLKQARDTYPNLKIVVVTGLGDEDTVKMAFQLGASDYVTKPFSLDDHALARAFFSD